MTPGRKFSTRISVLMASARTRALPSTVFRSIVMARLFRRIVAAYKETSCECLPMLRNGSPAGASTLMTSAPKSANSRAQAGPAMVEQSSNTL